MAVISSSLVSSSFSPIRNSRHPRITGNLEPTPTPASLAAEAPALSRGGRSSEEKSSTSEKRPKVLDDTKIEARGIMEFVEQSKSLIASSPGGGGGGGPPRWFSPLECGIRSEGSPLLLYLPGIDGIGLGLLPHHQRLGKMFDIWCLHIPVMDRTPFEGFCVHAYGRVFSRQCWDTLLQQKNRRCFVFGSNDVSPSLSKYIWFKMKVRRLIGHSPALMFGVFGHSIVEALNSSQLGLVAYVERTVKSENIHSPNKPIYLVGESLGACLALAIAARNPDIDFMLVLANPATSFRKSQLQSLSSYFDVMPEPLHATVPYTLSYFTGNPMIKAMAYTRNELPPQQAVRSLSESVAVMLCYLSFLADILPRESLLWKLKMLRTASLFANSRIHAVKAQMLVLASGRDQLLPSREEAERLCSVIPNCRIRHFKDSGHPIFLESGIDLVTVVKGACFYRRSKQIDHVSDYQLPNLSEFQHFVQPYRWINAATSPVLLTTLNNGKIVRSLEGIPSEGPVVLVGYHMLMGLELGHLISEFFLKRSIHLRGIAHPFIFDRYSETIMLDSSYFDGMRVMGAVPVSAMNFYKLLSRKSYVLLYPGGAREALHKKGEQYKLFWPEQSEFVRMAATFGATIIPFGIVGEDDIFDLVLDYEDLVKVPFYDVLLERINQDAVKMRTGYAGEIGNQKLYVPAMLPKLPGRFYYLFGRPIETRGRKEVLKNRESALELYLHVKSEVESCMAYLKEKREKDPYRNVLPRLLYQATRGFASEVPTFDF